MPRVRASHRPALCTAAPGFAAAAAVLHHGLLQAEQRALGIEQV